MPERIAVTEAFGVPVIDLFASTEGLVGHSEPGEAVLTFAGDTCIAECVDDEGRPVPDGTTSSKVLVTNLHNLTQPIIRYELTDRFTPAGTSAGGALRASVAGRAGVRWRAARQRGGAVRRPVPVRRGERAPVRHRCSAAARSRSARIPDPADRTGGRHLRGARPPLSP